MSSRLGKFGIGAALIAVALGNGDGVRAAPRDSGACRLVGLASFTSGLPGTEADHTYSLQGDLSMCQSPPGSSLSGFGKLSLGKVQTDAGTGFRWQEPLGASTGNCRTSSGNATVILTWPDGAVTIGDVQTRSVAAGFAMTGSIAPSVTLTAVDRQPGQPATKTLTTTRHGDGVLAATFAIPSVVQCPVGSTGLSLNGAMSIAIPD